MRTTRFAGTLLGEEWINDLLSKLGQKNHRNNYRLVFPAKAGIHSSHGHRPSPV